MTPKALAYFWARVSKSDGCWLWTGSTIPHGYGMSLAKDARQVLAHRLSWEIANGSKPPSDMEVCHRCDNPQCVNPQHLFLGTHEDNMRDAHEKGRLMPWQWGNPTHCKNGHEFTAENTYIPPGRRGRGRTRRMCVVCLRERLRRRRREMAARLGLVHNGDKTHCKRGHLFDDANTYTTSRGHRKCRECRRIKDEAVRALRQQAHA